MVGGGGRTPQTVRNGGAQGFRPRIVAVMARARPGRIRRVWDRLMHLPLAHHQMVVLLPRTPTNIRGRS